MESIEKANRLTLNMIQESLMIKNNKTAFLKMIFPVTLRQGEKNSLLEFIFNPDPSFQNMRSIFVNGNIIRNKQKNTYSRASQEVLNFISENMNSNSCLNDMKELLSKNFPYLKDETIERLQATDNDVYPENFKKILNNAVDCYQKLSCLVLWAVFGERINCINFSSDSGGKIMKAPNIYRYGDLIEYFNSNMQFIEEVESVEFAFLSGIRWLTDDERVDIIRKLINHNIKINVIIADSDISGQIINGMKNPDRSYIEPPVSIRMWRAFCTKNSNLVKLKISPLPILHSYYSFNMKNNKSSVFYILYTYGNIGFRKRLTQTLDSSSEFYRNLKDEFKYLWKISK